MSQTLEQFLAECEEHSPDWCHSDSGARADKLFAIIRVQAKALEQINSLDYYPELHNLKDASMCAICFAKESQAQVRKLVEG